MHKGVHGWGTRAEVANELSFGVTIPHLKIKMWGTQMLEFATQKRQPTMAASLSATDIVTAYFLAAARCAGAAFAAGLAAALASTTSPSFMMI